MDRYSLSLAILFPTPFRITEIRNPTRRVIFDFFRCIRCDGNQLIECVVV